MDRFRMLIKSLGNFVNSKFFVCFALCSLQIHLILEELGLERSDKLASILCFSCLCFLFCFYLCDLILFLEDKYKSKKNKNDVSINKENKL